MNQLAYMEEILRNDIPGFHSLCLTPAARVDYVSDNLCRMTGFAAEELLGEGYAAQVHPGDRESYRAFLETLRTAEQIRTAEYRFLKKDGSSLYVSDTMTSRQQPDGTMTATSVLTDITGLRQENENLRFLDETIPCGFLRYTCEKQPRITYINQRMKSLLRFPEGEDPELYQGNVFLLIPVEERQRFSSYLNRVSAADAPLAGEMTVLRCDGTRAQLFGWVTKCVNARGIEEFQSICMDVTERSRARRISETERYLKALTDVYDKIFEYDFGTNTVKCLHSSNSPMFRWLENIPMQMEEATEKWISATVKEEDQPRIRAFFKEAGRKQQDRTDEKPAQITYLARSSTGQMKLYRGIFLQMDANVRLYCCRHVPDTEEAVSLRSENVQLKENMQELVMRFTDGIAAFEITPQGMVSPLYASDNVCEFFGFSREEWMPLMQRPTPIEQFVANSDASYEEFAALLRNGEAEFTYFDLKSEQERRIRAVCSQKSPGGNASRYVMLYKVEEAGTDRENHKVSVRTFGYFDVFVDGKPIAFRNKKSKELFALLADRRGGYVSSEEAISYLWEDEPASPVTLARYRKVALRLKNILEEYGISDVVEAVDGKRRLVTEKVQCDLYDYLTGEEKYASLFKGAYLTNYSWGESTLAELLGRAWGKEEME